MLNRRLDHGDEHHGCRGFRDQLYDGAARAFFFLYVRCAGRSRTLRPAGEAVTAVVVNNL